MGQTLAIEVRELSPELLEDYLKFFDQAFSDFPHWAGCYCGFYDTLGNDWDPTVKAGPEHRAARAERIRSGRAQGLHAYFDGEPVGWCNAQPRKNFANMRSYTVAVTNPEESVGSIMCFLVSPQHRGEAFVLRCSILPVKSLGVTGWTSQRAILRLILLSGVVRFPGQRRTTRDP